jgi:hypothetical protein
VLGDEGQGINVLTFAATSYVQMLGGLKNWLVKAQQQWPAEQAEALLTARLAADMLPLSTQIRFSCVQALEGVYRLQGRDFPPIIDEILNEGRAGGEAAGSIADALARIDQTIALIEGEADESTCLARDAPIAHALPMGLTFDLNAEQFLRDWSLPQFYFHIVAAYAILRAQGVEIGKADYVGHMFAYLRPQPAAEE